MLRHPSSLSKKERRTRRALTVVDPRSGIVVPTMGPANTAPVLEPDTRPTLSLIVPNQRTADPAPRLVLVPSQIEAPHSTAGTTAPRPRRRRWRTAAALGAAAVLIVGPMALRGIWGVTASAVLTGSMRPAVQPGDLILTRRVPATELAVGDVAILDVPGHSILAHRIVEVRLDDGGSVVVRTRGDANPLPEEPVLIDPTASVAVMVGRVPALGYVADFFTWPSTLFVGLGLLLAANLLTVLVVLYPRSTVELRSGRKGERA